MKPLTPHDVDLATRAAWADRYEARCPECDWWCETGSLTMLQSWLVQHYNEDHLNG